MRMPSPLPGSFNSRISCICPEGVDGVNEPEEGGEGVNEPEEGVERVNEPEEGVERVNEP